MVGGDLSPQAGLLGSLLIDERLVPQALARVGEDDFTSPVYRDIFRAIRRCYTEGAPVDPVTVLTAMGGGRELRELLMQLMELTPTAAHWEAYAQAARQEARKARAKDLAGQILESGGLEEIQGLIGHLNALLVDRAGVERSTMEDGLLEFMARQTAPKTYIPTGLPKLDRHLYADFGDLVVLGGYPSAGKTALALQLAYRQAADLRVGFYSLETSRAKLMDRLIASVAGVELGRIKLGTLSEQQWQRVADTGKDLRSHGLELVEASGMTVQDIQADALARRYEAVYVDYLQLIEPETRRTTRTEQVGAISRGLQQLAHRHDILVVALSQLSRAEKSRGGERVAEPTMADLRESGQIEQDADAILLLYLEDPARPAKSRRVLKLAKNKDGERGRIYLVFDGPFQRFRESAVERGAPSAGAAGQWDTTDGEDPFPDAYPQEAIKL